jgi:hypothetical protein
MDQQFNRNLNTQQTSQTTSTTSTQSWDNSTWQLWQDTLTELCASTLRNTLTDPTMNDPQVINQSLQTLNQWCFALTNLILNQREQSLRTGTSTRAA